MLGQTAPSFRRLAQVARRHWLFIIAAPVALIVMTHPSLALVGDVDTWRALTGPSDIFMKYWDAWYGGELLAGRADFFHTDLLFHPNELSLAYHNFSLPHMLVFGGLQQVLPPVNAYVLTYLLIIAANLLSAYVFLLRLVSRPVVACAGAFVFGMSTFVLKHQDHPDMALMATIPLALYCLQRAVHEGQWRWSIFAGIAAGFTAFIGMYVFVCLMMTLSIYALFLAQTRWRDARFWQLLALVLLVAGAISLPRLVPMIADRALLDEALDKRSGEEQHNDLLLLFVNTDHPLMWRVKARLFAEGRLWKIADGYLGYLPIVVVSLCLLRSRRRRQLLPWLVLASLFIVLRLGSFLTIGGTQFANIPLPKHALDRLLPWIFEAFWDISNFQIGILLPWAALFCLSLDWLLGSLSARLRLAAVAAVLLVICVENYSITRWMISRDSQRLAWIDWLEGEGSADDLRLIHLPMGRNRSKEYGYFQTFNRIPHAEGLASRTPSHAYATIESNLLLSAWFDGDFQLCAAANKSDYLAAVEELRAHGFTHIIYHRTRIAQQTIFATFDYLPSVFDDNYVSVFRVDDLPLACDASQPLAVADRALQALLASRPTLLLDDFVSTLTLLDESLVTLRTPHSETRFELASENSRKQAQRIVKARVALLLAHDPQNVPDSLVQAYRDWLADDFVSCDLRLETAAIHVELMVRRGVSCEVVWSEEPLRIQYDNGIRLSTFFLSLDGRMLELQFLWRELVEDLHSFSLQLVNVEGERAFGADRVIYDSSQVHRMDVSALPAGDYQAKLIVYNYETGKSVSGLIVDTETRFRREVDIGTLTLE